MLNKAKQEAAKILENAKKTADEAIKEFNSNSNNKNIKDLEKTRFNIQSKLKKLSEGKHISIKSNVKKLDPSKLKIGDSVHVISYNSDGIISSTLDSKGMVFVNIGSMKIKVKSSDLAYANKTEEKEIKTSSTYKKTSNINIKPEIKLLGLYGYEPYLY